MIGFDGGGDSLSSLIVCTVIFTSYKEYNILKNHTSIASLSPHLFSWHSTDNDTALFHSLHYTHQFAIDIHIVASGMGRDGRGRAPRQCDSITVSLYELPVQFEVERRK